MTDRQSFVSAFYGGATQQVPVYEQAFASDAASAILGREAFTGATMLHYQEAVWAVRGPEAHAEFIARVQRDVVDLNLTLGFGAIAQPWLGSAPARQVGEYDFLYGDPDGYWEIKRYDPVAKTYGTVQYSRRPQWRGEEVIRAAVEAAHHSAENWEQLGGREGTRNHALKWMAIAGDRFEVLASGGMLSVPLNEEWLTACALVPHLVAEYLDAQVEIGRQQLEVQAQLGLRIVWGGGDLADNRGPTYGPPFFRRVVLPRYKALGDHCRRLGIKYLFRSDGNLWSITDDLFLDARLDGFGEIDCDAGMRIPDLQQRYPELTCWGNVSTRLLRDGTPDQVSEAAGEIVEQCRARGRLVLGSSNTVLPGTPPENYYALLEAAGRA